MEGTTTSASRGFFRTVNVSYFTEKDDKKPKIIFDSIDVYFQCRKVNFINANDFEKLNKKYFFSMFFM